MEREKSVLPTSICDLCGWIEWWLYEKQVNELRVKWHQQLAQVHMPEHVVVLCLWYYWENSAANCSVAGTCCKDWGLSWDPAAAHSTERSFFQRSSNCWLENPKDGYVWGQPFMWWRWRMQKCPGRFFLSSLFTTGSIICMIPHTPVLLWHQHLSLFYFFKLYPLKSCDEVT